VVLGNFNLSEIIRFAEVLKGLANPMLSVLCLFLSTMFSIFRSQAVVCGCARRVTFYVTRKRKLTHETNLSALIVAVVVMGGCPEIRRKVATLNPRP
jgi:hypothetical protein